MDKTQASQAAPMSSTERTSVNAEPKISSPYTRRTREEGIALIERNREIVKQIKQYMKDNNLLPKPCPAPKLIKKEDS